MITTVGQTGDTRMYGSRGVDKRTVEAGTDVALHTSDAVTGRRRS
jgi:hypothetical protein